MLKLLPKKAYLDKICGDLVRARGRCQNPACRSTRNLTWAHIIGRGCLRIRWRLDNALCLCLECHIYYDKTAEGRAKREEFFISVIGQKKYDELKAASSYEWNLFQKVNYGEILYYLRKQKKANFEYTSY